MAVSESNGKPDTEFIRLWPATEAGVFRGEFIPSHRRSYTVLARAGTAEATGALLPGDAIDEIPDVERRVVSIDVPGVTFESLCRTHSVDKVDLILIDTEGYDWQILKTIDLAAVRPRLLVYEHYHLSDEDRRRCRLAGGRADGAVRRAAEGSRAEPQH